MCNMYEIIEKLCNEKQITITQMCRDLKINRSSLSELKQGRAKSLSVDKVIKIAKYFGVTPEYISGEDNNSILVEAHNTPIYLDDETRDIIDSLRTRPEMKILFSVSKNVTKEDIEATVELLKRLRRDSGE